MTTDEIAAYYASLLILQYLGKPKAVGTVTAFVKPALMDQLIAAVQEAFNLETAVGVQLDTLGKYAGIARIVNTFTSRVVLGDDDYRLLIKVKILSNNSGSSLYDIQTLLQVYFPGTLLVFDYRNMRMDYMFDSAIGSMDLAEAFVTNGLLPKPMGVQLGALIYAVNINSFFGFRTYQVPAVKVRGFNRYTDYQTDRPWLRYSDAIVI